MSSLGVDTQLVRYPGDLDGCSSLIIPGGESTAMTKLIDYNGLTKPLREFTGSHPVFGTCAGMIMSALDLDDPRVKPLKIIPISVTRNTWGRQVHSFESEVNLSFDPDRPFSGTFIRAPKISKMDIGVKVLATLGDEPVMVTDGKNLMTAFHPEIGNDSRIHEYFLNMVK